MATPATTGNVQALPHRVSFRGLDIELARCTPTNRQAVQATETDAAANPLADLEALEERVAAEAAAKLAGDLLRDQRPNHDIEDALCDLRVYLDEHFTQRKLIRLYGR
ncbi:MULTISPECIES: hypothetical protein [Halomonas]|uniref:Uncharacterized protein n=1 Tax=Halomonas halophila TaxID=29573 RepID=A0ABQ0U6R8_9GAMM|nr:MULTISPECIES: hypothetical protein [Halomonas]MDR5891125.1 hypothetical protein [Halomonas salina]WJY08411.1 hypothetical protein QWG60_05720 [Halomonas halophila]GEK74212.1 hypothetical protein HHA04nite_27560 [Halomonas halophila]